MFETLQTNDNDEQEYSLRRRNQPSKQYIKMTLACIFEEGSWALQNKRVEIRSEIYFALTDFSKILSL